MAVLKYVVFFLSMAFAAHAQFTIKGHFNGVNNQQIILKGYNTLQQEIKFDQSTTDANGNFSLEYPDGIVGAAVIEITNGKQLIVLLNHENFEIKWEDPNSISSLKFINSIENTFFDEGLNVYRITEEKKAGIAYLLPYYANEPQKKQFFTDELQQLNKAIPDFLDKLPKDSYAIFYLKIRMLIADLQFAAKRSTEWLPELEAQFNDIDFGDTRLLHSGLYKELLHHYFATVENYGTNKAIPINRSTKAIVESLKPNPELKQEIATLLFNLFEKRSLFDASQYLALEMLDDKSCPLDDNRKALFEQYRRMAIGKTAPDIRFNLSKAAVQQLSQLKSKYKLVVFGASWCPACVTEIPKLQTFYARWQQQYRLEIVFVSLDTQQEDFTAFTQNFPWISSCDLNGWESKPVKDYCIFATPAMYLLDATATIRLKPITAAQVNAWLEFNH